MIRLRIVRKRSLFDIYFKTHSVRAFSGHANNEDYPSNNGVL